MKYNNATIRVRIPDRTKEEEKELVAKATERFLKAVAIQKGIFNEKNNKSDSNNQCSDLSDQHMHA